MNDAVYDAGALIAAERNNRALWAEHRVRLEAGVIPLVPAPVVAHVSRASRQVQLRRFLRGCDVVAFTDRHAHSVGALFKRSKTSDIVDGAVVVLAVEHRAEIVTANRDDIAPLVANSRTTLAIVDA